MKINSLNTALCFFKGKFEDRKAVEQLKQDNEYNLNDINARRIATAIDNLSELPGEENVKFLTEVSENLKYGTNIDLGKASFNDWKTKLNNAAAKSLAKSSVSVREKYAEKLEELNKKQNLNDTEKEILKLRKSLLAKVDYKALEDVKNKNIKELNRNLDYFIVSSEVPLSQKLYIMKRLNEFMSNKYHINPQLKDKKTLALAEIINDITIDTPESKIPNIKSVNQKSHGMCAAISICRKSLAYEDKVNFVDIIMSELDDSNELMIYDINKLGTHTKVPIQKTDIDYDYALANGYRIIDTSALNWMHVADNDLSSVSDSVNTYIAFDKENFDVFKDSHLLPDISDELGAEQDYFRALLKSEEVLQKCKTAISNAKNANIRKVQSLNANIEMSRNINNALGDILSEISPTCTSKEIHTLTNCLYKLRIPNSSQKDLLPEYMRDFAFLPNESENAKLEKIKAFVAITLKKHNPEKLSESAGDLLYYIRLQQTCNPTTQSSYAARNINKAKNLYSAAAAYRVQTDFRLDIPEKLDEEMRKFNIPCREKRIYDNIDMLILKLQNGTLSPKIREGLSMNFGIENTPEELIEVLSQTRNTFDSIAGDIADDIYASCLSKDRKTVLLNEINQIIDNIIQTENKETVSYFSRLLNVKDNPSSVLNVLNKFSQTLDSEDCTNERYLEIYNAMGRKNFVRELLDKYRYVGKILFENNENYDNSNILAGFNVMHGLDRNAPVEDTLSVFERIGENLDKVTTAVENIENSLEVRDENGYVLNTVNERELVLKKLEAIHEIIPEPDLRKLQERFTKIEGATTSANGETIKLKDLPPELTTLTGREKEVLNLIEKKLNSWNAITTRRLDEQYGYLKEPLEELNRQIGLKTGNAWVLKEGESGLASNQEVKIFEHMTDRPYYAEKDTKAALEKLKKSPYSGISSTSMHDKHPAYHAQYIADIKPLKVRTDTGYIEKDALFHDNTWGASEHENTWIDENGFTRTDYCANYGGEIGFITDEKYRSGKLFENIIGKYGTINNDKNAKYPMFSDIIIPGKSPQASGLVKQLRDNRIFSPTEYFDELENLAKDMSVSDIRSSIKRIETLGSTVEDDFSNIEKRICGEAFFDNGIKTREDYNKIPADDKMKLLFEKIAVLLSYSQIPDSKVFYKRLSDKELNKLKSSIRKTALKNFEYSFAKTPEIAIHGAESSRTEICNLLDEFTKENNISLSVNTKTDLVNSLKRIKKSDFSGSLMWTEYLMEQNFKNALYNKLPENLPSRDDKIEELTDKISEIIRNNMRFSEDDLNSPEFMSRNFAKWILRTFNPASNKEFVEIFNEIQDMTTEDFENLYGSHITDEDIGYKKIDPYDLIVKFRSNDDTTRNGVWNMLFNEQFGYNVKMSEFAPFYSYSKFNKTLSGARYVKKRTFDDMYIDFYNSLRILSYQNEYKQAGTNLFKNHRMFFGYPKNDFTSEDEQLQNMLQQLHEIVVDATDNVECYKLQDETIGILDRLQKYCSKSDNDCILPAKNLKHIQGELKNFLDMWQEDETIKNSINAARTIMTSENLTGKECKKLVNKIYKEISSYNIKADGSSNKDAAKSDINTININKKYFISNMIAPEYQRKAYELINKWIKAQAKNMPDAEEHFTRFVEFANKHKNYNKPADMLKEYMLRLAKDNPKTHNLPESERQIAEEITENYGRNIEHFLTCSKLLELQYILMNCAEESNLNVVREEFKNSQLQLNDGRIVTMDSDEGIEITVLPMFNDKNNDSAMMFIEQLGLTDKVAEYLCKKVDFERCYKNIGRIDSILTAVAKQTEIINKELTKLGSIENDPDAEPKLRQVKAKIIQKCNNTNFKATIPIINSVFDNVIEDIIKYPERSRDEMLKIMQHTIRDASLSVAQQSVDKLNRPIISLNQIIHICSNLKVTEGSPAKEKVDEFMEKADEIAKFAAECSNRRNI